MSLAQVQRLSLDETEHWIGERKVKKSLTNIEAWTRICIF